MRNAQRGVSIMGLLAALVALIFVALLGMKVVPSFLEFRSAKATIEAVSKQAQTVAEARRLFYNRAIIDDITSIKSDDLDVRRENNETIIGFAYRKEIPLFGPVGLHIDYVATTKGQ